MFCRLCPLILISKFSIRDDMFRGFTKFRLFTKFEILVAVPAVVAHAAPLPPCCVYPVKINSNVLKSTNEEAGKATMIFPPLVTCVCPLNGVSFNVCLLIPANDFILYNIPDGMLGGIFTMPPGSISLYDALII